MATLKYRAGNPYPTFPYKDPGSVLDYSFEWNDTEYPWLGSTETIISSSWTINGPDSSLVQESNNISGSQTIVWLSGGTAGIKYTITNEMTTSEGRTVQRSAYIEIKEL